MIVSMDIYYKRIVFFNGDDTRELKDTGDSGSFKRFLENSDLKSEIVNSDRRRSEGLGLREEKYFLILKDIVNY